jgi:hypothetical protein
MTPADQLFWYCLGGRLGGRVWYRLGARLGGRFRERLWVRLRDRLVRGR